MSATAADWPAPDQVPAMLEHISADRLERALRQGPLPEGEWCVRRLDVAVQLDPDRPLSALETDWADRIVTALRLSLRDGSQDVVRYLRPEQAVDDLLLGLSTGRDDHAWAWRQVGLLEPHDPEPLADPGSLFALVLARLPRGRAAALVRLVGAAGVSAVHRLLGTTGWVRAATIVATEAGTAWVPSDLVTRTPTQSRRSTDPARSGAPVPSEPVGSDAPDARPAGVEALAVAISASGTLAPALRNSGLRVDAATLQAWAVLVIAASGPSLLRAPPERLRRLVAAVGEQLLPQPEPGLLATQPRARAATSAAVRSLANGARAGSGPAIEVDPTDTGSATTSERRLTAPDTDAALGEPVERAEPTLGTRWGGLLFLLNSAADAGLPAVLDEAPFHAHPIPWVLHQLGRALIPVDSDDPALIAFCGETSGWPQGRLKKAERRAVATCAQNWIAATAHRLRPAGAGRGAVTDGELVQRLARRVATIEIEPGWVEVSLRVDEVDLDVRRAGLDIDPGWVWWLGHVVRFRYE